MNNKKKILFLVTQSEFGGAQRFIYGLVTNLNLDKYKILVAAGPEGDDEIGLLAVLEKNRINTKHLKYLRRGLNPFFDFCLGLIEIYKLIKKERPDILFLCSSKAGAMGSLIGRLAGVKKIIYRIGGWAFNDPRSFWSRIYYKLIEKISAKWKDIIINNAESDRKQAIKLGIKPKEKIITIYNGIDVNKMEFFSKEEARVCLKVRGSKPVIGTIANNYPSKGLKYLVKAMKNVDAELVIIGKGNRFIPEAYKYLKAFDIFVLPSIKEGFPWTILEAMAAEVPVVVTKVGAIPEIIKHGKNGILVEPGNSKELANAIKELLENRDLKEKFSKNGRRVVEEKFNLEQMIKKYEDLLSIN